MSYFYDVFLCVANDGKNFQCKEFKSFLEADDYYTKNFYHRSSPSHRSTMITSCKFMPMPLRMYKINKKLENLFKPSFRVTLTDSMAS